MNAYCAKYLFPLKYFISRKCKGIKEVMCPAKIHSFFCETCQIELSAQKNVTSPGMVSSFIKFVVFDFFDRSF